MFFKNPHFCYNEAVMTNSQHKRDLQYSTDYGHPWELDAKTELKPNVQEDKEYLDGFGEFVFGKGLKWYKEVAAWPMFILLLVEIGLRVMQTKYFVTINPDIFTGLINFTRLAVFVYLAVSGVKRYWANKKQILTASVLGGLVAGIILALFQLFWYFELWTFFNLIGQPLLLAAEGLVISWLVWQLFFKKK